MKEIVPAKEEKEIIYSVFTNSFPKEKYQESNTQIGMETLTSIQSTGKWSLSKHGMFQNVK